MIPALLAAARGATMIGPALPGTDIAIEKAKLLAKYLREHGRDYNVPLPARAAGAPNSGDNKDLELGNKHE